MTTIKVGGWLVDVNRIVAIGDWTEGSYKFEVQFERGRLELEVANKREWEYLVDMWKNAQ